MNIRSILSELVRNISTGTTRAVVFMIVASLCATLFGLFDAVSVVSVEQEVTQRLQHDADARIASGAQFDGNACDRLSFAQGDAIASGALRTGPQVTLLATPGKDVASYEVTPGMIEIVDRNATTRTTKDTTRSHEPNNSNAANDSHPAHPTKVSDTGGLWISENLAHDFGLSVGSLLETDHGNATIAGIYAWPNDGRDTRLAYAILTPVSATDGTFAECWVQQWPFSAQTEELMSSTAVTNRENQTNITSLNKQYDAKFDAHKQYNSRVTSHIALIALLLGLLLGFLAVFPRRLEYAGALHAGQTKTDQMASIMLETAVWCLGALVCSLLILTAYCARTSHGSTAELLAVACRPAIALCFAIMVGAFATGMSIREKHLFKLFKRR